jgi:multidrug efflux system outer membrane protein
MKGEKLRNRWASAAAASLVLILTGCTVGPNYEKPKYPVPSAWNEAQQSEFDSRSPEQPRWWSAFNDPLLGTLVERAIRSNLDLRVAEARIRQARAARTVAASGAWPTVNTSTAYSRTRNSANTFSSSGPSGGGNLEHDLFVTGFDASWEIDVFGGVRRSVEAADANIGVSVEDRRATLVTLLGDVAKNYIDLRGFQLRLDVARANLKAQQETLELTRVRFEAGLASDLDVAQAETLVNATAAQIPPLESSLKQSAYSLDTLLGLEPGALWGELSKEAPIPQLPPRVLVGLPSELLRRRPDIRRAERQLAAATAQVGVATAELFPKFSLTGMFNLESISASDWLTGPSRFWTVGPTIRWTIFDAGKIRANIEISNAQQAEALALYEKAILTGLQDVENSLVSYAKEQARNRSLVKAVTANKRAVELVNELYSRGLVDFLNVLVTQRALYSSEDTLAQSNALIASDLVSLYKALGGGWQIP